MNSRGRRCGTSPPRPACYVEWQARQHGTPPQQRRRRPNGTLPASRSTLSHRRRRCRFSTSSSQLPSRETPALPPGPARRPTSLAAHLPHSPPRSPTLQPPPATVGPRQLDQQQSHFPQWCRLLRHPFPPRPSHRRPWRRWVAPQRDRHLTSPRRPLRPRRDRTRICPNCSG